MGTTAKSVAPDGLFAPVDIDVRQGSDGTFVLTNRLPLGAYPDTLVETLRYWATSRPNATFLAQRRGGEWERVSFGEMWERTAVLAARLLGAGCSIERPILILAPNSIAHAELVLAAMRVGIPAAPVSTAFAMASGDLSRLRDAAELITPRLAYFPAEPRYDAAAASVAGAVEIVVRGSDWSALSVAATDAVRRAESAIGPSTIAKLLFTSGSTDKPKAVPNTHRMLCSNQAALATIWPWLKAAPPVLVDWLPWNHTFGGNFCFNLTLVNGGTLYIDSGKPTAPLLDVTLANLREIAPTVYFNVPAGYETLLPHLENDLNFAQHFFSRLAFLFSAAAALPQTTRDRLDVLTRNIRGTALPILTGWGSTETAPCCTSVFARTAVANNIGLPLPGIEVKLAPDAEKFELLVRGPNVMSGYWRQPAASANAFDEEGFYHMGDAGVLIDWQQPEKGIAFDGRIAENFKLRTGTWVNVGALRIALIDAGSPFIQDAVITGHDRDEIGVLVFPDLASCRRLIDSSPDEQGWAGHPLLVDRIRRCLAAHNRGSMGSSAHVASFLVLAIPPRPDRLEITDKGYLNQRAVLRERADDVLRVHGPEGHRVEP